MIRAAPVVPPVMNMRQYISLDIIRYTSKMTTTHRFNCGPMDRPKSLMAQLAIIAARPTRRTYAQLLRLFSRLFQSLFCIFPAGRMDILDTLQRQILLRTEEGRGAARATRRFYDQVHAPIAPYISVPSLYQVALLVVVVMSVGTYRKCIRAQISIISTSA